MDKRMSCTRVRVLKDLSSLSEDRVDVSRQSRAFRESIDVGVLIGNKLDNLAVVEGTSVHENKLCDKSSSLPAALVTRPTGITRKISEVHPNWDQGNVALRLRSMVDRFSSKDLGNQPTQLSPKLSLP